MKRNIFGRVATVTAFVASAIVAQPAAAQTGQLNITGSINLTQQFPGLLENVTLDFRSPDGPPNGVVTTCCGAGDQTGVFAILPQNGFGGVNLDLTFGPMAAPAPTPTPVNFLNIGGFSFTATSFGPGNVPGTPFFLSQVGNTVFASLNVVGTVTGPGIVGYALFSGGYSTQFPNTTIASLVNQVAFGPGILAKTVSATFEVSAVPEPATVALLGAGLVGILGVGLRRRNNV